MSLNDIMTLLLEVCLHYMGCLVEVLSSLNSCVTAALSTSCLFIFLNGWLRSPEQLDSQQMWENIYSLSSLLAAANESHLSDEKYFRMWAYMTVLKKCFITWIFWMMTNFHGSWRFVHKEEIYLEHTWKENRWPL